MRSFSTTSLLVFAALLGVLGGGAWLLFSGGGAQAFGWPAVEHMIASDHPGARSISTDSLAERLDAPSQPRPVLLDVRTPEEYAVSHLAEAHRLAPDARPDSALQDSLLARLPRATPIVTYCSVGYRSAAMAERLQQAGFTNVANLRGSIFRWANEGRPVYRKGERVHAVHPYDRLWGRLLDDDLHALTP